MFCYNYSGGYMKIVKRDGRIVEYNRDKIAIAINKANNDVAEIDRVSDKQIDTIIKHIEELNKKRMLVEDIQDMIETELMKLKKFNLAKAYIIYRYNRALVRKNNVTDESILAIIKNNNITSDHSKKIINVVTQRELIADEVSKNLTKRVLLPEKIIEAQNEGILYFHDAEYFVQPIINSSIINLNDMLTNGFVINNTFHKTNSFLEACINLSEIIVSLVNSQYKGFTINVRDLAKYLMNTETNIKNKFKKIEIDKKDKKELIDSCINNDLSSGIRLINNTINDLEEIVSREVTLFLELSDDDEYINYTSMIIEEVLNQRLKGTLNENNKYVTQDRPKLVYLLNDNNNLTGGKYDNITMLALECTKKRLEPRYVSSKVMMDMYDTITPPIGKEIFLPTYKDGDSYKNTGRFSQGIITINLVQIALLSENNEDTFYNILDDRLNLCLEALMYRYHSLTGTISNQSPLDYKYGAINRLKDYERIDKLLRNGYSTLSFGFLGLNEASHILTKSSIYEEIGERFATKLLKYLHKICNDWKKTTGVTINLYNCHDDFISKFFANIDKDTFGTIKGINDKNYYNYGYNVEVSTLPLLQRLEYEKKYQEIVDGGTICLINIDENHDLSELIKYLSNNILYTKFYTKKDYCMNCDYLGEMTINNKDEWECPMCHSDNIIIRRNTEV